MLQDIEKVLLNEEVIKEKIKELSLRISNDYKGKDLLICIKSKNSDLLNQIEFKLNFK